MLALPIITAHWPMYGKLIFISLGDTNSQNLVEDQPSNHKLLGKDNFDSNHELRSCVRKSDTCLVEACTRKSGNKKSSVRKSHTSNSDAGKSQIAPQRDNSRFASSNKIDERKKGGPKC